MIRKSFPGFITSLGLLSGCVSISYSLSWNLYLAGILILIACVFDFFDGMTARILNSLSEFGKQLDSLADVISFGVAPAMIMRQLMILALENGSTPADPGGFFYQVMIFLPFLIAVFSALRLAKFNLDNEQADQFKGLPTPANAIFITGLGFIRVRSVSQSMLGLTGNEWFLLLIIILSCTLLVSRLSMFSLKFKNYRLKSNGVRYFLLVSSIILLLLLGFQALTLIIVAYIVLSLMNTLLGASHHR